MKKMRKRFVTTLWYCCLVGVLTLGLVSIVGTGGDDDGGGGGSDILPVYNFTIDMDPPQLNDMAVPQEPQPPDKPGPLKVSYSGYVLELSGVVYGSIDTRDNGYTIFDAGPDDASTIAKAHVLVGLESIFGLLTLDVTEDIVIPADDPPTSGAWTVRSEAMPQGAPVVEIITVTVVTDPEPGVTIYSNVEGGVPVFYSWGDFEALLENVTKDDWERMAGASGSVIRFLVENSQFITTAFDIIPIVLDSEHGVPLRDYCSEFDADENPEGIIPEGYNDFTWFDVTQDGEVGPGDRFEWEFVDCWRDDPDDNVDDLYRGIIDFWNYVDVEEDGVTTRIGFEPPPDEGPGGVYFDNFELSEIVWYEGEYIHDTTYAVTVNGGFTIVFYEPED